jgi:hypothetical protein
MTAIKTEMSAQVKALKTTDLSPMINMSNLITPRMLGVFLSKLDDKERKVINQVMPIGKGKKIFFQLVGSATPPIVVEIAQPMKMTTLTESDVKMQRIKGIRINVEDVQLLTEHKIGSFVWRIKSQIGAILGMTGIFTPFIKLGPKGLKNLQNKAMMHFKPLLDMMPQ